MIAEGTTRVKDYLNKTKLENLDYVINPYVGCPHKCIYCYASYMASFSKHKEKWGDFIDVKRTCKKINVFKIKNKKVVMSTVTDPYNCFEKKYELTKMILEQLVKSEGIITINTKSKLVLRDIELLKQIKNLEVAISISVSDDKLRQKLEPESSSVEERIEALKILSENGIKTCVYIAPVIPMFTDYKKIIELTKDFAEYYLFEKLSLRSSSKTKMFDFIAGEFPIYNSLYANIYSNNDETYFDDVFKEIKEYCEAQNISYKFNY